jgi:hypothetical protein
MSITEELSKTEYQIGTNQQRFELLKSKTVSTVGKIAYGNTLHLVSMLARGLRARIDACTNPALKNAWSEALQPAYLASPAYSINVALPEIRYMLDNGLAAGLISADDHAFIIQLATYERQLFPDATLRDVVAHFNPELIDGQWHETEPTDSRRFSITLNSAVPEVTHILVQWLGSDGVWYHATALHGILAPVPYSADIPYHGSPRKLRWRCDYALDGQVTVA